jgi:hypothetical protein
MVTSFYQNHVYRIAVIELSKLRPLLTAQVLELLTSFPPPLVSVGFELLFLYTQKSQVPTVAYFVRLDYYITSTVSFIVTHFCFMANARMGI